ncbi:MAG TPA: preprotein translocase subunit SecE [Patescibacteria group bacterium]|nr:preprotein translocase subunit SecE [Patescibacteria group bacterium]
MIKKAINYFSGSYEELKKVVWPNRKEIQSHTIIVILSILISMGIIALLDLGLFNLLELLINK